MYYLTTIDVLEYLTKRNAENILFESFKNKQKDININFLKKHLFYDIEFLCKNIQSNIHSSLGAQNIKMINDKVYISIDLKKIYECFQNIFNCEKWISIDYLNYKENYHNLNYPVLNIDLNECFKTDFKDIICKSLQSSIYEILNEKMENKDFSSLVENNNQLNCFCKMNKLYIFVKYDKLHKYWSDEDSKDNKINFNDKFKNIFLLF